jgi:hypothetical protein
MTHGRSVYIGYDDKGSFYEGLLDVTAPGGYLGLNIVKAAAYGWSKTTELAKKRPSSVSEIPENNADTLALIGSSNGPSSRKILSTVTNEFLVCKLMDDPNNPRKVDIKGRIIPLR